MEEGVIALRLMHDALGTYGERPAPYSCSLPWRCWAGCRLQLLAACAALPRRLPLLAGPGAAAALSSTTATASSDVRCVRPGGYAADAGFADGAESHAVASVKVLLRLFERNPENVGVAWRAEVSTNLVWLGQRGSFDARKAATAALLSCVLTASGVPLEELAESGALEMAVVNASTGGAGGAALPSAPASKLAALADRENLRVLSMQLLARVAMRGAHRQLMEAGAGTLVCRTMADACAAGWGEGGDCSEPLVGAAVGLAECLSSSPETHAELLGEEAVRWLFHTARRDMEIHNPVAATAALAYLLEPFRRAAEHDEWEYLPLNTHEEVDVDYRGFGAWYPASLQKITYEADESVSEDDENEESMAHRRVGSVDLIYHCDGSRDRGVQPTRLFRHVLFCQPPSALPEPESEPEPEPEPQPLEPPQLLSPGVGRLLALALSPPRRTPTATLSPQRQQQPRGSRAEQALQAKWSSGTATSATAATEKSLRRWLPSLPVKALRALGKQLCDLVRDHGVDGSDVEAAVLLGTTLRGIAAVATHVHPSLIYSADWLRNPQSQAALSPLLACIVAIADPPAGARAMSVSGLDNFTFAGPRTGKTLSELSLTALLHLAIGDERIERLLPHPLMKAARAPLDAARSRLLYTMGATHRRLGSRSVLFLLPPDLSSLIGKRLRTAQLLGVQLGTHAR